MNQVYWHMKSVVYPTQTVTDSNIDEIPSLMGDLSVCSRAHVTGLDVSGGEDAALTLTGCSESSENWWRNFRNLAGLDP